MGLRLLPSLKSKASLTQIPLTSISPDEPTVIELGNAPPTLMAFKLTDPEGSIICPCMSKLVADQFNFPKAGRANKAFLSTVIEPVVAIFRLLIPELFKKSLFKCNAAETAEALLIVGIESSGLKFVNKASLLNTTDCPL